MKKVFIFNGKFLSAQPTGVHRVAEELIIAVNRLVQEDQELNARFEFILWVPGNAAIAAKKLDVPYRVIGPLKGIAWEQLTLPMKVRQATLINFCNIGPALMRDCMTMIHDAQVHIAPDSYSPAFRAWYRFIQPISGKRHRKILTVSDYSRQQLEHYGVAPTDKTLVIHNGVDHVLHVASDRSVLARLGLERHRYLVALANLQPHKNIALLLKTFADPRLGHLKLVLVGNAGKREFVEAGHGVPDNVLFAGRISDEALRALYEDGLALAFPSLTEGFGLPPLEAMIAHCPAIVAPMGALPEVCADAGIYADAHDAAAWAQAILLLANDPAYRAQMGERSFAHAQNFTWDRAARTLLSCIMAL